MAIPGSTSATPIFLGREEAAELLGISARTIDSAIKAGELPAFRIGRRILIKRETLIRFAETEKVTA